MGEEGERGERRRKREKKEEDVQDQQDEEEKRTGKREEVGTGGRKPQHRLWQSVL